MFPKSELMIYLGIASGEHGNLFMYYEAQNIFRPKINQISQIHTPRNRTKIELPAR